MCIWVCCGFFFLLLLWLDFNVKRWTCVLGYTLISKWMKTFIKITIIIFQVLCWLHSRLCVHIVKIKLIRLYGMTSIWSLIEKRLITHKWSAPAQIERLTDVLIDRTPNVFASPFHYGLLTHFHLGFNAGLGCHWLSSATTATIKLIVSILIRVEHSPSTTFKNG